jgi:hypothetical protein
VHYPLALTDFELAPSSSAGPAIPTPLADAATIYTRTYADWADAVFGETTALPDSDNDGDGQSNLMEYLASTDPTNPASYFAPLYAPDPQNTGFSLRVDSVYGVRYQLQSSADLLNWTPAPPVLIGDGSIIEFTLPEPVAGEKDFYRVELVP